MSGQASLLQNMKGQLGKSAKITVARYSLVTVQFAVAIMLISGTLIIKKQITFMMNNDPKFDKENVVVA